MSQSRKHSAIEAVVNVLIGYWVSFLTQLAVFPIFDIKISVVQNLWIGVIFTVVSLVRSYALRRLFNYWSLTRG